MSEVLWITVLGGLGSGAMGALIVAWFQRKKTAAESGKLQAETNKTEADTNEIIRATVMKLIEPLTARIVELEKKIEKYERVTAYYLKRIVYLTDGIRQLMEQIEKADLIPCWKPADWKAED
jgi:hypothetical protein